MCRLVRYKLVSCDGATTPCIKCRRLCCVSHSVAVGASAHRLCLYCRDEIADNKLLQAPEKIAIASRKAGNVASFDRQITLMEKP